MHKVIKLGLFLFVGMFALTANAQQFHDSHQYWSVYTIKQDGRKICYIASSPISKSGNYSRRDEPYILVTDVSGDVDEFSTSSGYPYKYGSEVRVKIGRNTHKLFTKGELAWAYNTSHDKKLVKLMKKGAKMTVKGTSQKGTYSIDTYSLKGFTKAYKEMKAICRG